MKPAAVIHTTLEHGLNMTVTAFHVGAGLPAITLSRAPLRYRRQAGSYN
jgi:hypothetical protein